MPLASAANRGFALTALIVVLLLAISVLPGTPAGPATTVMPSFFAAPPAT